MRRAAILAALALAWLGLGLYGAFSYGNAYNTYRGFPPPKDPAGVTPGRVVHESFYSTALHKQRSFLVYTPPGYAAEAARGKRFPVLYLLHGSPGRPSQFLNIAAAGVALDSLLHEHRVKPFLIVMPDGSDGTFRKETEWANTPHGNYESLVLETVHTVDARFPTHRGRRYRAIGGNSEGAYAAVNIALRHPKIFETAESWSGYARERATGAFANATPALIQANSPADYLPMKIAQLRRYPFRAFIYSGDQDRGLPARRAFAGELLAAGAHVRFSPFPGGHDWGLWRAQTPRMLLYAARGFAGAL